MKKILSAALAVSLVTSAGAASAAPYNNHNNHRIEQQRKQAERAHDRYVRAASRHYNAGRYVQPHGYQQRAWRHGERLPASYRSRVYVVDHHRYGLRAPPRGYEYVRVGNDAVLTAIASGVIASVIVGLFN